MSIPPERRQGRSPLVVPPPARMAPSPSIFTSCSRPSRAGAPAASPCGCRAGPPAAPSPSRPPPAGQNGATPVDLPELQQALEAVRAGDFSVRLPAGRAGAMDRISVLFNDIVGANQSMGQERGGI